MTDKEFEQLKIDLEAKMREVNELQKKYRVETGREFVPPIKLNNE